ncbi:MAG: D-Ala-D-Ala carboxypeptidase family metallohydrolase [Bacteroidaceae bacterium]|nr:D-Ala-D-Ala carboxypeptidase family metallohydrolase [Bacteroidaceae bacterium]
MKYFTLGELCKSTTATKQGIRNTPTAVQIRRLTALTDNVLDPLREAFGAPIVVNSGFRSNTLNAAVGGAANSQHVTGEAVDIEAYTRTREDNKRLFDLILSLGLPFDQLINEFDYDWVHVSFRETGNRREVLAAHKSGKRTTYTKL